MIARFILTAACLALVGFPLAAQDADEAPADGPETKFTGADLFGLSVA
ncbi:MAG: hypothetical protein GVX90_06280, partial [Alphaproteobacteria bacterium]|nr:hypothetical protein [Alphaproteobacteria bacterium]